MRVEFFREVSTDKRRAASEIAQKVFSKVTIHSVKRKVNLPCAFFFSPVVSFLFVMTLKV